MSLKKRQIITDSLEKLFEEVEPQVPKGYPHIGIAIIDSCFSLRTHYSTVENILFKKLSKNSAIAELGGVDFKKWLYEPSNESELTIARLLELLDGKSNEELGELFNKQKSPGTNIMKAETVRAVAHALKCEGIDTRNDLKLGYKDRRAEIKRSVLDVPGVGQATWKYILSLCGIEEVKPDVMIHRWVNKKLKVAGEEKVGTSEAGQLLEGAAIALEKSRRVKSDDFYESPVRIADHTVWKKESGRLGNI